MDDLDIERERLALFQATVKAYSPSQPREPKGNPNAGKWRDTGRPSAYDLNSARKQFMENPHDSNVEVVSMGDAGMLGMEGDVVLQTELRWYGISGLRAIGDRLGWISIHGLPLDEDSSNWDGLYKVSFILPGKRELERS